MSHYLSELYYLNDVYTNVNFGKLSEIASNVLPRLIREFDLELLIVPPTHSYPRVEEMSVSLPLNINRTTQVDISNMTQIAFHITTTLASEFKSDDSKHLTVNNRGRIDTVNINVAKDFQWHTPNIVNHIHKGLAWLTNFQLSQDRGVFYTQTDMSYNFHTHLHTLTLNDEEYVVQLAIVLPKTCFSIRPN